MARNREQKNKVAVSGDILTQLENRKSSLQLEVEGNVLSLTNLNKVLWPGGKDDSISKRDYIIYLLQVSKALLPQLKDRPITLVRFPNGVTGQRFFQKHWVRNLPDFVDTVRYYSEQGKTDKDFLICNNLSTLVWLGQIADLELHVSYSRIDPEPDAGGLQGKFTGSVAQLENSVINYPDYLVFDLDPYIYSGNEAKGEEPELHKSGFHKTCQIALRLKEILDDRKLPSFLKTSGRTGLHVFVPVIRNLNYDQIRSAAEKIGKYLLQQEPKNVTMDWSVVKRTGKIFFDHNMNVRGKTLPSAYSARSSAEATVSTPVTWDELPLIYPTDFTLKTVPARLLSVGDLWAGILDHKVDLKKLL